MVNLERYILLIEINSQMACWYTHQIIMEIMGSIPNLTTVASRFDGRVKVPLLEKSNDSWKDSNLVRWRNGRRTSELLVKSDGILRYP